MPRAKQPMTKAKIIGGLLGLCIGDAMGVPVEGVSRAFLDEKPVNDLVGYESSPIPPGTWSDDSSLTFCLAQSLVENKEVNIGDIGKKFVKWLYEGYWTPFGYAFGIGFTTKVAIERIRSGINPARSGLNDEYSNGNGSLMRILPLAFYLYNKKLEDQFEKTHIVSRITHAHLRSQIACGIFMQFAINLIKGHTIKQSYNNSIRTSLYYYSKPPFKAELPHFQRILIENINRIPREKIYSDGYVIHTLEASLWCLLRNNSYEETVLAAVNLGHDSDTTGSVTGGLAGLYYGLDRIPEKWIKTVVRSENIIKLGYELYRTFFK